MAIPRRIGSKGMTLSTTLNTELTFAQRLAEGARQRTIKNGFGCCGRCSMKWNTVASHSTPYGMYGSMFPLCVHCWADLTPETRLPYYEALWLEWLDYDGEHRDIWPGIKSAVLSGL